MAGFTNTIITTAGVNAIAAASARDPIKFTRVLASTSYYDPSSFSASQATHTGAIASVSANGDVARVVGRLSGQTDEVIRTIAIEGYVQSRGPSQAVIIAACSDSASTLHVTGSYEVFVNLEFGFNSVPAGAFYTSDSNFATLGDLVHYWNLDADEVQYDGNAVFRGNIDADTCDFTCSNAYTSSIATGVLNVSEYDNFLQIGSSGDLNRGCYVQVGLPTTFEQKVTFENGAEFTGGRLYVGNMTVRAHTTMQGNLNVSGDYRSAGSVTCSVLTTGSASVTGNLTVNGSLNALIPTPTDVVPVASWVTVQVPRGAIIWTKISQGTLGVQQDYMHAGDIITISSHQLGIARATTNSNDPFWDEDPNRFLPAGLYALLHAVDLSNDQSVACMVIKL